MKMHGESEKCPPLLLVGGGGHCHAVIDVLERAGTPIGGIIHGPGEPLDTVLGYPAVGYDENLAALRATYSHALLTVGQTRSANTRKKLYALLKHLHFTLPVIVSPLAYVSNRAILGDGTIVMHQALVNSGALIGKNCIINTQALIEHDCYVGSSSHIAVAATLCGGVTLGDDSFVGAGSVIREGVSIGSNVVIGCGVTIKRNIHADSIIRENVL